jgi:hypothetical protein
MATGYVNHVAGRYEARVLLAEAGRLLVRLRESQQEEAGKQIFLFPLQKCSLFVFSLVSFGIPKPDLAALKSVKKILMFILVALVYCVPNVRSV